MNNGTQDERFPLLFGLPLPEAVCRLQDWGYQVSLSFTGPGGAVAEEARVVRVTFSAPGEAAVVAACGWDKPPVPPSKE